MSHSHKHPKEGAKYLVSIIKNAVLAKMTLVLSMTEIIDMLTNHQQKKLTELAKTCCCCLLVNARSHSNAAWTKIGAHEMCNLWDVTWEKDLTEMAILDNFEGLFVCLFLWKPTFEGSWVSLMGFSLTSGAGEDGNAPFRAQELQITTLVNPGIQTNFLPPRPVQS